MKHLALPRLPYTSMLLSLVAVTLALMPQAASGLQYDRAALAAGALWRALTCHWTHFNATHLGWDTVTFLVLGVLCERLHYARFTGCVLGSAAVIPGVLWVGQPQMTTYRGLSGIDSALFALLIGLLVREAGPELRWRSLLIPLIMGALFLAKIGYEIVIGTTLFVDRSATVMMPVPLAHGVGALVGLLTAFLPRYSRKAP